MSTSDVDGKAEWERAYCKASKGLLWRDQPVPYAKTAAELFAREKVRFLLELPSGDAKNTAVLAPSANTVILSDSSPTALQAATRRIKSEGINNCIAIKADGYCLEFADEQFDAVFCWDLLGHLNDPRPVLRELLRVTKVNGLLVGSVFGEGDSTLSADGMRHLAENDYLYRESFFFRFYAEEDVCTLIEKLGATTVSVSLAQWVEGPHEGYREYSHAHESWAFTLRKERQ